MQNFSPVLQLEGLEKKIAKIGLTAPGILAPLTARLSQVKLEAATAVAVARLKVIDRS